MGRTLQFHKDRHVHQPSALGHRDIEIGGMEKTLEHDAKYSIICGVFCHVKQLISSHTSFANLASKPFMLLETVLSWNPISDYMKLKSPEKKKRVFSFFVSFFRSLFLLSFCPSFLSFSI